MELGLHACNLPVEVGGGGLPVSVMLVKELVGRPWRWLNVPTGH